MSDIIFDARGLAGARGILVNVDTASRIRWARWANLTTGQYEAFLLAPAIIRAQRLVPAQHILHGRAHLRFVPFAPRVVGANKPHTASEIAEMVRHARRGQPLIVMEGVECDEPKCHKLAAWQTVDEQEIEPAVGAERTTERAVAVKAWRWCDWHYRFPTFTSLRGVQSETQVKARPS